MLRNGSGKCESQRGPWRLEDSNLADLASLALKDRAFAVFEEMEEDDKTDFEKIAEALLTGVRRRSYLSTRGVHRAEVCLQEKEWTHI